jgi:ABC-type uncharacterized transport system substrate-binding protein
VKRRAFITLLGGAAVAWPLAANAQQAERVRSIGVLMSIAPDPEGQARLAAFLQALQALGWTDGLNVRIETRWGAGNIETIRKFAAELIALGPDVILVSGGTGAGPLLQLTRTVPVVFTQTPDPVGAGFVDSLARPGGNATGFTLSEYGISGKLLEVLKEISPNVTRAAVIRDPAIQQGIGLWSAIQTTAPAFGIEVSPVNMRSAADVEHSMQSFAQLPNGGLIVTGSGLVIVHRELRSANASR